MTREEAYQFLYKLAEGISQMFGKNCETVIHELRDGEVWSIAIFNGHVSGRTANTTMGIFGKPIGIEVFSQEQIQKDNCNQLVIHPSGKMIKSSTFFLRGEDYQFALGINYDITLMEQMKRMLGDFTASEGDLFSNISEEKGGEIHLENIFETCLEAMHKPIPEMKKEERKAMVKLLRERNFFNLQRSVPYAAGKLGVSKYTIYKYLNEIEREG
ncbi:MAG: PAS domain-containing protein [Eubacteriales bacterium]|nr:PAS domain-containing protein [Eubacteriales bacterium]